MFRSTKHPLEEAYGVAAISENLPILGRSGIASDNYKSEFLVKVPRGGKVRDHQADRKCAQIHLFRQETRPRWIGPVSQSPLLAPQQSVPVVPFLKVPDLGPIGEIARRWLKFGTDGDHNICCWRRFTVRPYEDCQPNPIFRSLPGHLRWCDY